eukprot:5384534-Pyramimonas_sp.AAC.3
MMPGDGSPLCSCMCMCMCMCMCVGVCMLVLVCVTYRPQGEHHCARVPGEVRDAAREQPHGRGAQLHARQHQPHLRASQALHRAEPGGEERRAHPDGAEVAPVASRVRQAENGRRIVSEVGQRAAREEVVESMLNLCVEFSGLERALDE